MTPADQRDIPSDRTMSCSTVKARGGLEFSSELVEDLLADDDSHFSPSPCFGE